MEMRRRRRWRGEDRIATVAVLLVCVIVILVIAAAERGLFSRLSAGASGVAIPGVTLDDDDDDGHGGAPMPVVTSLRSDSEAERLGIRVGDHIAAVGDHPVRTVATLRAAVRADREQGPVALHIVRGSALWTVAIDRAEPPAGPPETKAEHGAQDPAG